MQRGSRQSGRSVSRRHFLRRAATGAGAAVAASAAESHQQGSAPTAALAAPTPSHPLRVPAEFSAEFSAAAQTVPVSLQFPMTGAQVFAQACKDEGVAALFCCPGGAFRGFSEKARAGGTTEFRFTWLTRDPLVLRYDPRRSTLTFGGLLPGVARGSPLLAEVQALVGSRHVRSLPAHRRIDKRRVEVECAHGRGAVSVVLHVKGKHRVLVGGVRAPIGMTLLWGSMN